MVGMLLLESSCALLIIFLSTSAPPPPMSYVIQFKALVTIEGYLSCDYLCLNSSVNNGKLNVVEYRVICCRRKCNILKEVMERVNASVASV
jgi:hypothetical protein